MYKILGFLLFQISSAVLYPTGLGGAHLSVLCQPTRVAKGGIANIQVQYSVDVNRPTDLHFDLLQEPGKQWLAGETIALSDNNGSLSINVTVPLQLDETRILWKVFLTPRGDRFPNMLAELGLNLPITDESSPPCPYLYPTSNVVTQQDIDFVIIQSSDSNITSSTPFTLTIVYALRTQEQGYIGVNVMDEQTNTWIFGIPIIPVERTDHNQTIHLNIDHLFSHILPADSIYLDVSLNPLNMDWDHRLAEDRTYKLHISW